MAHAHANRFGAGARPLSAAEAGWIACLGETALSQLQAMGGSRGRTAALAVAVLGGLEVTALNRTQAPVKVQLTISCANIPAARCPEIRQYTVYVPGRRLATSNGAVSPGSSSGVAWSWPSTARS